VAFAGRRLAWLVSRAPLRASTLIAILSRLRALFPEAEFTCICLNHEAVVARDGIDAVQITTKVARIGI
jgi:hypothetical protein